MTIIKNIEEIKEVLNKGKKIKSLDMYHSVSLWIEDNQLLCSENGNDTDIYPPFDSLEEIVNELKEFKVI